MSERVNPGTDVKFIRYLKQNGGETMKKCFQCATCTVVCDLSPVENPFPRKEMINAGWGRKDKLVADPDIWLCHACMDCSQKCPRGARPGDLMAAVRNYVYRFYAFPRFMGEALSSPKYLPALLVIPVILISLLVFATQDWNLGNLFPLPSGEFKYADFIAHGPIEMLFMFGNILIFTLAFLGFKRYWDDLHNYNDYGTPKRNFLKAVYTVFTDFMFHRKFDKCSNNSNRYYAHLMVFYGFVGALIATAIVVFNIFGEKLGLFPKFLPEHMNLPVAMLFGSQGATEHYALELTGLFVKLFGVISGSLLVFGGLMMLIRRSQMPAKESQSNYNDMLFLWMLWGVSSTGMLLVFLRIGQLPAIAYPTYFVHLVMVYFLLWYMPFSKFAHMIYRFLGLTYLAMHDRTARQEIHMTNGFHIKQEEKEALETAS